MTQSHFNFGCIKHSNKSPSTLPILIYRTLELVWFFTTRLREKQRLRLPSGYFAEYKPFVKVFKLQFFWKCLVKGINLKINIISGSKALWSRFLRKRLKSQRPEKFQNFQIIIQTESSKVMWNCNSHSDLKENWTSKSNFWRGIELKIWQFRVKN